MKTIVYLVRNKSGSVSEFFYHCGTEEEYQNAIKRMHHDRQVYLSWYVEDADTGERLDTVQAGE